MKKDIFFLLILSILICITRFPFISPILYSWDSVQFALALEKFDVRLYQPHPPGYILFVLMGKIFNFFIKDANLSFIAINIIFSFLSTAILFSLGCAIKNKYVGISSSLFFLFSSVFWFEGVTAFPYIMECFFSILCAYLCYLTISGNEKILLNSFILALAGGVRQNLILFLLPLFLYSIFYFRKNLFSNILKSGIIFTLVCIAWFLPMCYFSGGISEYRKVLAGQLEYVLKFSFFKGGYPALLENTKKTLLYTIFGGVGVPSILAVFYFVKLAIFKNKIIFDKKNFFYFLFWIIPSFLFYCIVFIDPPSYTLTYVPALFILISLCFLEVISVFNNKNFKKMFFFSLSIFIILEAGVFLLHFPKIIKKNYSDFKMKLETLKKNFSPEETILITSLKRGSKIVNYYRHTMYYLPEYKSYFLPEIETTEKQKSSLYAQWRKQNKLVFERKNREQILKIPENIKFLVIFDEHLVKWSKNKLAKISTGNRNWLYYYRRKKEKYIIYKYHYFCFK